ncbi:MAG: hypothetical protein M1818_006503 [Claussenomyces sp. TS43310]|nr:MAG: hypothetical protein M1818_006503 [Claussenomyces sp. TS43310]
MQNNSSPRLPTTLANEWVQQQPQLPREPWCDKVNTAGKADGFSIHFSEGESIPLDIDRQRKLGRGSRTVVHEASYTQRSTGKKQLVAAKILTPSAENLEQCVGAIHTEIKAMERVSHPHVVRILGSYDDGEDHVILMLPVATCNLAELLSTFKGCDNKQRAMQDKCNDLERLLTSTVGCLAQGVLHIHDKKVRHKDIKPQNILFDGQRVLLADFGISRIFESTNQTGSMGFTSGAAGTARYAPKEILENKKYRGRAADIFSLGCVYTEIFAYHKEDTLDHLNEVMKDPENPENMGKYSDNVGPVLAKLRSLITDRCDVQFYRLVSSMLEEDCTKRPSALKVWGSAVNMLSANNFFFCGSCCMPVVPADSALRLVKDDDLCPLQHHVSPRFQGEAFHEDAEFTYKIPASVTPPYERLRNLRLTNYSILDEVRTDDDRGNSVYCRKRIWPESDEHEHILDIKRAASDEAKILKHLSHRHVVKLAGTYQQGRTLCLVMNSSASFELHHYLDLVELWLERPKRSKVIQWTIEADCRKLLHESFGCLSGALAYLHKENIPHGDIQSQNILILKDGRIVFAEFGKASVNLRRKNEVITFTGLGESEEQHYATNKQIGPGAFSDEKYDDVFALGTVFLQMYTVLRRRKVPEMNSKCDKFHYRECREQLCSWLAELGDDGNRPEGKFSRTLHRMLSADPADRVAAEDVYEAMKDCTSRDGFTFCGNRCS